MGLWNIIRSSVREIIVSWCPITSLEGFDANFSGDLLLELRNACAVMTAPHGTSVTAAGNRSTPRKLAGLGKVKIDNTLFTYDQYMTSTNI